MPDAVQIMNARKAYTVFLIHQPIQIIVDAIKIDIGTVPTAIVVTQFYY
jgi:hypothetical protein